MGTATPFIRVQKNGPLTYGSILVGRYQEGYIEVCRQVSELPLSKSSSSKAERLTTRNCSSYLEVGIHPYGCCSGFASDTQKQYYSIWVVVDRLTKSDVIPIKFTSSAEDIDRVFIDDIVCLHGISLSIILDRLHNLHIGFRSHSKMGWYEGKIKYRFSFPSEWSRGSYYSKLSEYS